MKILLPNHISMEGHSIMSLVSLGFSQIWTAGLDWQIFLHSIQNRWSVGIIWGLITVIVVIGSAKGDPLQQSHFQQTISFIPGTSCAATVYNPRFLPMFRQNFFPPRMFPNIFKSFASFVGVSTSCSYFFFFSQFANWWWVKNPNCVNFILATYQSPTGPPPTPPLSCFCHTVRFHPQHSKRLPHFNVNTCSRFHSLLPC